MWQLFLVILDGFLHPLNKFWGKKHVFKELPVAFVAFANSIAFEAFFVRNAFGQKATSPQQARRHPLKNWENRMGGFRKGGGLQITDLSSNPTSQ